MKTLKAIIFIAIVAAMAIPATAFMEPDFDDPNEIWPFTFEDITADESWEGDILLTNYTNDEPYLLLDYYTNNYGEEWTLWYDWDYDCAFWIGLAPMETYQTYTMSSKVKAYIKDQKMMTSSESQSTYLPISSLPGGFEKAL
jgi:hypothetical protein